MYMFMCIYDMIMIMIVLFGYLQSIILLIHFYNYYLNHHYYYYHFYYNFLTFS